MLKVWILTVTTATPGLYAQPDAVIPSEWATEKDCRQAEALEQKIAELKKTPILTKCREAEVLGTFKYSDEYRKKKLSETGEN